MRHLIIGYGTVGRNLSNELHNLSPDIYDKYKGLSCKFLEQYDVGWICVDTPIGKDGLLDISEVKNAISENSCDYYVIKSTVPVGTTCKLANQIGSNIIFSPEFYGGTQHCNNFNFDFTILGGDKKVCTVIQQELQKCYDARHKFRITDSNTAEMVKFMENAWLATKVTFCCEMAKACTLAGVYYEDARELFLLDPRINPSHTFVYRSNPYYESHCLDKDVPSIANQFDIDLLKQVISINEKNKNLTYEV